MGSLFIRKFIKSLLFFTFFAGFSTICYQAVMHAWGSREPEIIPRRELSGDQKIITAASIDAVSKNLIYCIDEDTGEITGLILEIFHCTNKKLSYITIPVKTQFTMSEELYQQLILIQPVIPQFIKVSGITKYFPSDTVYEYGVLLAEDLLGIKISYYTVVPGDIYETVFRTGDRGTGKEYPAEVFTEEFKDFLHTLHTEEELIGYIKELYKSLRSNLNLAGKLNYIESYLQTPMKNISFDVIEGQDSNSSYTIDPELAAGLLQKYLDE